MIPTNHQTSTPLRSTAGRQSPFKRPDNASPATSGRAHTPTQSPTKSPAPSRSFGRPASATPSSGEELSASAIRPIPTPALSRFDGALSSPAERPTPSASLPSQISLSSTSTANNHPLNSSVTSRRPHQNTTALAATTTATSTATTSGGYNQIPAPILRSIRESFEVLDNNNTGTISLAAVKAMLEQLGCPTTTTELNSFFPASGPNVINLARYLDILSAPLAELSHAEELSAAFAAFDVDDSGQVDVAELRRAVLQTAAEPGEEIIRLRESEVDAILGEFAGRRAFGAKGLYAAKGHGQSQKGDVFRYRDFIGRINGGGDTGSGGEIVGV